MDRFIPLSVPNIKGNEQSYVDDALALEWVSTGGAYITRMEKAVAEYTKTPEAVACQSGTAALHLSLICCGVEPGDEVIVPTLTFVAAVNPVKYAGAEPVFMDCDDSLCMDMDKLALFFEEECDHTGGSLTDRRTGRRIAAVIVVHVFGNIADMEKLMDMGKRYGFPVIEDATEALGSRVEKGRYAGRFAGTIGDIGAYSFNGNKIITTGGGGMIVSSRPGWLDRARYLSTQAKDDPVYFVHNAIGYNYRMTNVQAAIGVGQMERLEDFIETKRKNYRCYIENGIPLLPFREGTRPNYWFYSHLSERRDELVGYLDRNRIQSRPVWHLIHTLKPYENCRSYRMEKAPYYGDRIINLPCSTNLSEREVARVARTIKQFG
jgi:perosamine synthetase